MPMIEPFIHRCTIKSGSLAGNEHSEEVCAYEIEYREKCSECGELLAPHDEVLAHIYGQLLKE